MGNIHSFQFSAFLRALFLILSATVFTALIGIPALVCSLFDHSRCWSSSFQKVWVHCLFFTNGIRFRVEGQENLKKGDADILSANYFDRKTRTLMEKVRKLVINQKRNPPSINS